ncbi:NACHT domain-containing protein [Fusarium sp. LHS14.1]|nr:NACHT domain-containing protein [Fusarium sp. LHS14.1]
MEGLGAAASVIAVVDMSAKVASLCTDYFKAVKNARSDIECLQSELDSLTTVLRGTERLVKGPDGNKLQTTEELEAALAGASVQLQRLIDELERKHGRTRKVMSRFGIRSLKWPFESSEIESIVQSLDRNQDTISAALMVDNTALNIETHSNVKRISSGVQHISRTLDMSRIPVAKGAAFDSQTNEHDPKCLPNTRVELRQTIAAWAEDPHSDTIFWLNGMAGTGKSTISRTISHSFAQKNMLGASFFFKRGERDRGNASRLFTTIAAQLMTRLPEIGPLTIKAIDDEPDLPNKFIQEQFEKLILGPLQELDRDISYSRVLVLVIDALDECDRDSDVRLIINILTRLKSLNRIKLKVFVTSRPELPIRLGFNSIKGRYRDLVLHEIPKPIIEHDISEFFHHQLEQARLEYNGQLDPRGQLGPEWPGTNATDALIQMAIPLFIFAATICRFIQDPLYDPMAQLDKVLRYKSLAQDSEMQKLDTTYRPTLDQLLVGRTGRARENLLRDFRDVVGAIILLAEPLSISILSCLVEIPEPAIHGILRHLHSVLSVPNSSQEPVRMLHLSFHDFLVDKELHDTNPFWVDEQKMHKRIATKCLDLLCSGGHLKQDICNLGWPGTRRTDIEQGDVHLRLPGHVRYACLYWTHHLEGSCLKITDSHQAFSFLKTYFLFWLEALALLGEAHKCSSMLAALQLLVDPNHGAEISSFLRDAARFIARSDNIIDKYPLQIYASGLVFAPSESIVRTAFWKFRPGWITQLPVVPKSWDASIRVIETSSDRRSAMCFLPDSRGLQTVSPGGVVQVWDSMTGKQIDSLKADGGHNMLFSWDGERSLSTNRDRTILFWGSQVGSLQYQFAKSIESLALSPDGKQAACALRNSPAVVLDCRKDRMPQRFYGAEGELTGSPRIALSPDGQLLAVTRGHALQLWNIDSGEKTEHFLDNTEVGHVCFSPDSKLIAATQLGRIVLNHARTGGVFRRLGDHTGWVMAIAFTSDGRHVASASRDKTIRLWHLATGNEVNRFTHKYDNLNKLAFSSDGRLLAASTTSMILLWDPTVKHDAVGLEGYQAPIQQLALSRDRKQAASISKADRIDIWDLNTAQNIKAIESDEVIRGVSFSQVQENLVWSVSPVDTVNCHDSISGKQISVDRLYDKNHRVQRDTVFSPDGDNVAFLSATNLNIWSLQAREMRQQHALASDEMFDGARLFSSDGKIFASVDTYGGVMVLDLTSGCIKEKELRNVLLGRGIGVTYSLCDFILAASSRILPEVRFWDINTGDFLGIIRVNNPLDYIEFDAAGSRLTTGQGYIEVPPLNCYDPEEPEPHRDFEGYGLTRNLAWITWKGRPFIWLPPSYRPQPPSRNCKTALFVGSTVVLGITSGCMSILKFVETPPWETSGKQALGVL